MNLKYAQSQWEMRHHHLSSNNLILFHLLNRSISALVEKELAEILRGTEITSMPEAEIEALTGAEDWQTWKVRLSDILIDADLWDYVSGDASCPSSPSPNVMAEVKAEIEKTIKEWRSKD
ncbi:hypothetical protein DAEQUDRAFT_768305 [Daedalea quercina L-15889]|uniref:Uncharacterized protein n=1 Tax=Daedalea quercina L-15889 TaxID=1314783 RepID=A0A165MS62_9APHY|nr:hypothetical protein DAEQUDRAFT_768305 [Daedalea quercina L-15889]